MGVCVCVCVYAEAIYVESMHEYPEQKFVMRSTSSAVCSVANLRRRGKKTRKDRNIRAATPFSSSAVPSARPIPTLSAERIQFSMQEPARNYRIVLFAGAGLLRAYRASPMDHQSRLFAAENRQSAPFFPGRPPTSLSVFSLGFPLWRIVFRLARAVLGKKLRRASGKRDIATSPSVADDDGVGGGGGGDGVCDIVIAAGATT